MTIEPAPFDRDLELAVMGADVATHALVFPCRRALEGWIKTLTGHPVQIHLTHWRNWDK
ncbi:hypothetical protein [Bradyrhizobium acaciae]|uniref:hypothetical protein n=1 Tax=Bradyrhizobium acaciae TaxID=2683706 RepID=UPI003083FDAD